MSAAQEKGLKTSGVLFIAAGGMFFLAAAFARQVAFCGIGAAFIAIGATYIAKAKTKAE
jgi:hypothetical protein